MQHIEIIVGSQMGSAEYVAEQLQEALQDQGIVTALHEQPMLNDIVHPLWLVVTSTYGAGDYPDNLLSFISELDQQNNLDHIDFAVVGIGDTSYDTYNFAAKNCSQLLINKGATQLLANLEIDVLGDALPEDTALQWLPQLLEKLTQTK
ncbi:MULTISPECIES: FMN-binding protein MioC [Pseudoalteromonas]|uniref:FMN-binding protein MioC n=1 Tax=Pseudoalteromonas amylolytica TaxID=1859457 RepID=A0A1S1MMM8_9GAMM|nr:MULTISPECIES: FMN-binding protein MioC [Pseudoalteromonas]OHU84767.1 FMN-binding protein MioC [Pseudoalteromonas sp. JW3]OHU86446.1 FMN-binding protein MioC [Pseudoalteromonas amylolytica]